MPLAVQGSQAGHGAEALKHMAKNIRVAAFNVTASSVTKAILRARQSQRRAEFPSESVKREQCPQEVKLK